MIMREFKMTRLIYIDVMTVRTMDLAGLCVRAVIQAHVYRIGGISEIEGH